MIETSNSSFNGNFLNDTLSRRVIFVTGKGGVGKTTLAWSIARACHHQGARVTVVSWNPLEGTGEAEAGTRYGVNWLRLETLATFREYAIQILKFEAIYQVVFENHVLKTFIRAAPGLAETVVAGKIWSLYDKREQDLLVVDLPSSGHAVTFFQSPLGIQKIFAVGFVHKEAEKISDLFESKDSRIDLVALPEELPLVEGLQLKDKLSALHQFKFGYLHINSCTPSFPPPESSAWEQSGPEIRAVRDRHLERLRVEEESLRLVPRFEMPSHRIPRFPSATTDDTLDEVTHLLEKA